MQELFVSWLISILNVILNIIVTPSVLSSTKRLISIVQALAERGQFFWSNLRCFGGIRADRDKENKFKQKKKKKLFHIWNLIIF